MQVMHMRILRRLKIIHSFATHSKKMTSAKQQSALSFLTAWHPRLGAKSLIKTHVTLDDARTISELLIYEMINEFIVQAAPMDDTSLTTTNAHQYQTIVISTAGYYDVVCHSSKMLSVHPTTWQCDITGLMSILLNLYVGLSSKDPAIGHYINPLNGAWIYGKYGSNATPSFHMHVSIDRIAGMLKTVITEQDGTNHHSDVAFDDCSADVDFYAVIMFNSLWMHPAEVANRRTMTFTNVTFDS